MTATENKAHHDAGTQRKRVIVVGAGIAGLAVALRMDREGWEVVVVERARARRSSGYLVNLHGPGYDAAEGLGLLSALNPKDIGFFTSILVNADGREKFVSPAAVAEAAVGTRALSVFRGDLESVLYEAVADLADIRFGTTVRAVTQNGSEVDVALSDGSSMQAELLVGADGVHSGIRELVFGSETDYLVDLGHIVGAFPLDQVPEYVPEGAGTTFLGPGRMAAVMNMGRERSSVFLTYRWPDAAAERNLGPISAFTRAFGDLGGGVPDALRRLADDNVADVYFDSVGQIVIDRWSRGRVVLLGDAAWCVTVFAGYGAALALDGADRLGAALRNEMTTFPQHWMHGRLRFAPKSANDKHWHAKE